MKACIYNEKKGTKDKLYRKSEMGIFLPSATPGFSRNPYVEIILQNKGKDTVIDIPIKEIKKLLKSHAH